MAKRISLYAAFTALSLGFSYVESFLPLDFIAPGIKIGLANLAPVFLLIRKDALGAFSVNAARIMLSSIIFGRLSMVLYSLAGAALSYAVMFVLSKLKIFSAVGISAAGGAAHNIAQLLVSLLFVPAGVFYYLPVLTAVGTVCGILMGILCTLVDRRIKTAGI